MNPKISVIFPVGDREARFSKPLQDDRRIHMRHPEADGLMQSPGKIPEIWPATA